MKNLSFSPQVICLPSGQDEGHVPYGHPVLYGEDEGDTMTVLSFGELLWDIIKGQPHIGGAPFNLAAHLARLDARAILVSALGSDRLGAEARAQAGRFGIACEYIQTHPGLPTGTVQVELDPHGVPDFTIRENVAWDAITLTDDQLATLAREKIDAMCFGTLAQRSRANRETLNTLLTRLKPAEVLYDVNLRQSYYDKTWIEHSLRHSTIVKLNDTEVHRLADLLFGRDLDEAAFARRLCTAFPVRVVCITRGAHGAAVYQDGTWLAIPGQAVTVADTVGAGDAFSAGFLYATLAGRDAMAAARFANALGAFVAAHTGAVPEYTEEIRAALAGI